MGENELKGWRKGKKKEEKGKRKGIDEEKMG